MKGTLGVLAEAYAPVEAPLAAVREVFDEELNTDLPFVDDLCTHVLGYRGKMLRPALLLLSAKACGSVTDKHIVLAAVLEMVHIATLVHDDVLDEARMRRRLPTINAMNDNETAVPVGDYLISHAYHLCSSLNSQFASRYIASCTNSVCEGELLQVHHRHNWSLSEQEYLAIVSRKTSPLTRAACILGAKYAGASPAVTAALDSYGMQAGIAFQMVDDVLDLVGTEQEMGKTLGRDLAEGKLTLPIIHLASCASADALSKFKLYGCATNGSLRAEIQTLLQDGVAYAMDRARQHVHKALGCLSGLPTSPARDSLQALTEFILDRRG